ncbi:uncharacterized protein FTJAE_5434 [Fusarium tjaetaba]|uniref:F-box domain-containing protein n=1 Tax=Fusarium tjaetaba TaxID=1567544 RepID=A0A8H5RRG6_9HYPO|nr:uncharacterized protein FTJAE_5434 [Fusarium tjaetaba]KAF5638188.1 hypothetical protein FTJAE_5434 [Fusarium tjaetaba]
MSLITLPQELLGEVFSFDHGLSRRDLKSLRLTCRQVSTEASRTLFYQVRISLLLPDLRHFFELSESPLASLVRVLVWEELTFDVSKFQHPWYPSPVIYNEKGYKFKSLSKEMAELVSFHFPVGFQDISVFARHPDPVGAHMMQHSRRPIPKSKSPDEFLSAVRNMPNLHTLVSRPMDGHRRLEILSLDFPMTINSLKGILQGLGTNKRSNTGFRDYFMPLLESLASQPNDEVPTNKITRLFYSDEHVGRYSALLQMEEPVKLKIFEHFVRLDLCLCDKFHSAQASRGFTACLANAKSLTSLKICNENDFIPFNPIIIPTLPKLMSVEFVKISGCPYFNFISAAHGFQDASISGIISFIQRHAETLRSLCFTSSRVGVSFLKELAKLNSLQLDRLVIASADDINNDDDDYCSRPTSIRRLLNRENHKHIDEQVVLAYVNRADGLDQKIPLPPHIGEATQISTHSLVVDTATCELSAFHDTRKREWDRP